MDMISSIIGSELWTAACVSDIEDAVGFVGSGGGKCDNVADKDESGSK